MRSYFKKPLAFANWRIVILQFACAALFALSLQNLVQNAVDWAQISLRLSTMWLAVLGGIAVWQVQKIGNRLRRLAGPDATQPRSPENDLAHIEQRLNQLDRTQTLAQTQLRETAAQDERNRLARDLHDTIKQQLFSINMAAATAQSLSETDPNTAREMLVEVRNLSQQAQVEMRAMLTQLRPQPLATVGLVQALRDQLEALHFRSEVQTELIGDVLPDESQLRLGVQEALFRVTQEALSNVARHARAKHASVAISHTPSHLTLSIADDGQGFDTRNTKAGMGLNNMRARIAEIGGDLTMESAMDNGTHINIRVPLLQPKRAVSEDEKEARNQRVRQLSYLIAGVLACLLSPLSAVWGVSVGASTAGVDNPQRLTAVLQTLFIVFGGMGVVGVFVLARSIRWRYRELVMQCGDAWRGGPWQRMLRSLIIFTVSGVLMLAALIVLTLQWPLAAAALGVGCAATYAVGWRMEMQLNEVFPEWASQRFLRTLVAENSLAYGLIAGFLVLLIAFAGLPSNSLTVFTFPPTRLSDASFSILSLVVSLALGLPLVALYTLRLRNYQQSQRLLASPTDNPSKPMTPSQKTSIAFPLIWFALGIVNAIRGDWPSMALALTLGTGLLISRDANLNNWRDVRKSPRQMLGLALAVIALVMLIAQVGYDFGRSLRP
jgi:signal transduction histidine kinase